MSPQRFGVLEYLARSGDHPTVDQILDNLKRLYPRPSRESVCTTLLMLRDAGIVSERIREDRAVCYGLSFEPPHPSDDLEDD